MLQPCVDLQLQDSTVQSVLLVYTAFALSCIERSMQCSGKE
jgi:hypothetical protein